MGDIVTLINISLKSESLSEKGFRRFSRPYHDADIDQVLINSAQILINFHCTQPMSAQGCQGKGSAVVGSIAQGR